jgi:PAS domain S-box-containing protein
MNDESGEGAYEALRDSEMKFRTVLQLSNDAVILFDEQGEIHFWNSGAEKTFGYCEKEMLGQPIDILLPPGLQQRHHDLLHEMAGREESGTSGKLAMELEGKRKDGSIFNAELSFASWKSGTQAVFSVIIRDVTERKAAEEALHRGEKYFRSLIENSQDLTLVLNEDGSMRYVSPSFLKIFGFQPDEVTGQDAFSFVHPDDLPELVSIFAEGIGQPGLTVMAEYRIRHADGSWVYVEAFAKNLLHDPAVAGIVINSRDITARRQAEEALRHREEYYRNLIENGLDIISILGADGTILYESPSYERILGFSPEEMVGKSAFDFLHPDDVPEMIQVFMEGVKTPGLIRTGEFHLRHRDGSWFCFESIGKNLLDDPVVQGVVVNSRDITERKRYEQALEDNARQLKDFLSVASHELHHPIAIVKGYAQSLAEEMGETENQRERLMVDALEKAVDRLTRLGDNLLDVSRLEQDRIPMRFARVEPAAILRQSIADMEARGFSNPFELRVTDDPVRVNADEDELLRVLVILEENAVSFSAPDSPIGLELGRQGDDILISVLDRGRGVPEEQKEHIFERFFQVENILHHSRPGLGLGLYIAREIVEEHGGRIWQEPRPGGGSIFRFTIPIH